MTAKIGDQRIAPKKKTVDLPSIGNKTSQRYMFKFGTHPLDSDHVGQSHPTLIQLIRIHNLFFTYKNDGGCPQGRLRSLEIELGHERKTLIYLHRFEHTFGAYTKSLQPLQRSRNPYINPLQMVPGVPSSWSQAATITSGLAKQSTELWYRCLRSLAFGQYRSIGITVWIKYSCPRDRTLPNSAQTRPQHL
jgi:hypothetical protein